jgi:hypothetical protein
MGRCVCETFVSFIGGYVHCEGCTCGLSHSQLPREEMLLLGLSGLSRDDDIGRWPGVLGLIVDGEAIHSGDSRCCGLYDTGRVSGSGRRLTKDVSSLVFGVLSGSFLNVASGLKDEVGRSGFVHLSNRSESLSSFGSSSMTSGFSSTIGGFSSSASLFCSFVTSGCWSLSSSTSETSKCSYIGRSSHRVVTDFSRCKFRKASSESAIKPSMCCAFAESLLIGRGCLKSGCTSSWT